MSDLRDFSFMERREHRIGQAVDLWMKVFQSSSEVFWWKRAQEADCALWAFWYRFGDGLGTFRAYDIARASAERGESDAA